MQLDAALTAMEGELRAAMETAIQNIVAAARTRLESLLEEVEQERNEGLAQVQAKRAELEREFEAMQTHQEQTEGRVELEVGGRRFVTSVQTLRRVKGTYFDAYFSGRYAMELAEDGSVFIDRDGEAFGHLLEYLRTGMVRGRTCC